MTSEDEIPPAWDPSHPIVAFDGAITTRVIPHQHRAFAFEVTFQLQHPQLISLSTQKPPAHFHPHQEEYMQVIEGRLGVEVEGREHVLSHADGEFKIEPWTNHRLYPLVKGKKGSNKTRNNSEESITKFLLSGQETDELFRLDTVFFQNWYGYQDEVVGTGVKMDLIQAMSMFDAGGSYMSIPSWIPFSRSLSRATGIIVGRWIGSMLGYQPFYRKWTTDWDLACEKMGTSYFQRRFADRTKTR